MNFRVLAGLCPLLASALLVACADRPKSDSGESVPSVSAGKLTKSAVTLPAGARDEAARAALPAIERAKVWYRRAAERGHTKAMHNLGVILAAGGTKVDFASAADWFREAAERNLADSQYNLAVMYESGRGVDVNLAATEFPQAALEYHDTVMGEALEAPALPRGQDPKTLDAAGRYAVGATRLTFRWPTSLVGFTSPHAEPCATGGQGASGIATLRNDTR